MKKIVCGLTKSQPIIFLFLFVSGMLLFAGCQKDAAPLPPANPAVPVSPHPQSTASETDTAAVLLDAEEYIAGLASGFAKTYISTSMDEVEQIETIYCNITEKIYFAEPPDRDYWIYHSNPESPPSYLYHRAMAPLAYGIGSCEDFAAALTLTLRAAGFEAQYVSGLTVSAQRQWVDHAWTVVKLGEDWYHLDSQLEQNVTSDGRLTYRYFLRDDKWMLADHLWGKWLANYWQGKQTPEQRERLLNTMTPPLCEGSPIPRPPEKKIMLDKSEHSDTLNRLREERANYLEKHGQIPSNLGEWEPPIFSVMPQNAKSHTPYGTSTN